MNRFFKKIINGLLCLLISLLKIFFYCILLGMPTNLMVYYMYNSRMIRLFLPDYSDQADLIMFRYMLPTYLVMFLYGFMIHCILRKKINYRFLSVKAWLSYFWYVLLIISSSVFLFFILHPFSVLLRDLIREYIPYLDVSSITSNIEKYFIAF